MNHQYQVEILEPVGGQLMLIDQTPVFEAVYVEARSVLIAAIDISVKLADETFGPNTCVVTPIGDRGARLTWTFANGNQMVRELDLVRIGDAS